MSGANRKKVLLMGKSGSGKTSMRSIIFANFLAKDTQRLNPTLDVQHSSVRFLGSLVLNLWDCGGQDAFYESYFASQRDHVFRNVAVLIYVFDIESRDLEKDMAYYQSTVTALAEHSPDAHVAVLVHKMDLVPVAMRDRVFDDRAALIRERSGALRLSCFKTSIWDETLYKAWSSIVHGLIPNIGVLEGHLRALAHACDADEVVLFERDTYLVIVHTATRPIADVERHEKLSNIVKQFRIAAAKSAGSFQGLRAGNSAFSVLLDAFTSTTHILVVTSDPAVPEDATLLNIALARAPFEKLISDVT